MSADRDELAIQTIRALSMDAVEAAASGHPGTPMALAPIGWLIFRRLRRHDPSHPAWADRDRFVLSCGHASMLQYSLLHLAGYDLPLDELRAFRQWDSRAPGHPEVDHTPGVETTTGPLGQGLANAVGMALAERHLAIRFNQPGHALFDHRTWVIASDGDVMEGVSHEAASLAGHLRLGKLIVFYDDNRITIDGNLSLSMSEDVAARFGAYGWHTVDVADGNDLSALSDAADAAIADPRPSLIRVRTVIGYPAPNKQGTASAHGAPLGSSEVKAAKEAMGWEHPPFHVPAELEEEAEAIRKTGEGQWQEWNASRARYRDAFPELSNDLDRVLSGALVGGWDEKLPSFEVGKGIATRKASGKVLQAIAKELPELVGGSADLAGSNNTYLEGLADFAPEEGERPPRNLHYGVREHAMASAMNGMALHGGVIPYGATFLVFSDYCRPALRLAALMGIPTRYVFTHDSIGLGEDGPTHQPVEHLASLRAIPGFTVLRPADANEVRECWRVAIGRKGPAALILSRQSVPTLDRSELAASDGARRGAYVVADSASPKVLIIATGSEVALALEAKKTLDREQLPCRVVSMPSWEVFAEQDRSYRDEVLPPNLRSRVVVEAGTRMGWERWVGADGGFVTLDRFGASAPAPVLFEKFGFTAAAVVTEARRVAAG